MTCHDTFSHMLTCGACRRRIINWVRRCDDGENWQGLLHEAIIYPAILDGDD